MDRNEIKREIVTEHVYECDDREDREERENRFKPATFRDDSPVKKELQMKMNEVMRELGNDCKGNVLDFL